jgi:SAM-dependent methyltransferase
MRAFDFTAANSQLPIASVDGAIRIILDHMHRQLGWSLEECEQRVAIESARELPKGVFYTLGHLGWKLSGVRLLDVGAGLGGTVLEALERGADARGVEPGDGFRTVARMRLAEAGHDPGRISAAPGETLPFLKNSFDYVISLQVLEHVRDPLLLMREMYRVLKPGGQCYISCENYLSFREQHYRIPWLPMLPKSIGAVYLRAIGRDPAFFRDYVRYSTYPQIWRSAREVGFKNVTYDALTNRIDSPAPFRSDLVRVTARALQVLPIAARRRLVMALLHLNALCRVGVRVRLLKPVNQ